MEIHLKLSIAEQKLLGEIEYKNAGGEQYIILNNNFSIKKIANCLKDEEKIIKIEKVSKIKFSCGVNYVYKLPSSAEHLKISFENISNFSFGRNYCEISDKIINLDSYYCQYYPLILRSNFSDLKEQLYSTDDNEYHPIILDNFGEYEVLNADNGELLFPCLYAPYKLLAFKKKYLNKTALKGITVYVRQKKELKRAANLVDLTHKIIEWYNVNLFPKKKLTGENYIYSLSNCRLNNGFYRGNLITYDKIGNDGKYFAFVYIAHEIAHYWGNCDNSIESYAERCLEEGVAEWCAMLLRYYNDKHLYRKILQKRLKTSVKAEKLIERRKIEFSTHSRGFDMFYDIFKNYGADKTADCLRHFAQAERRTAHGFLEEIKRHETAAFYDYIENLLKKALTQ